MMGYLLDVLHNDGCLSRHEFPGKGSIWDHYSQYQREIDAGYFARVVVYKWSRRDELWFKVASYPMEY